MEAKTRTDFIASPKSFVAAWGGPVAILLAAGVFRDALPNAASVLIIALALAWAGAGCVMNALRCGRRHCYLSGPALLLGAAATLAFGFNLIPPGADALNAVIWGTLGLVLLSFAPELIWGRYVLR